MPYKNAVPLALTLDKDKVPDKEKVMRIQVEL